MYAKDLNILKICSRLVDVRDDMILHVRGLSVKFVDTANKTRIKYQRRMKFCINKYQLSGTMHTQYDSMFLHID